MRNRESILFFICLFAASPLFAADPVVAGLESTSPEVFNPPKIKTHVFDNGLKLYFLENRELPVVEMSALIKVGSVDDPGDKKGLTNFMMSGIRTGGGGGRDGDQFDEELEKMAAQIRVDAKKEFSTMKLSILSQDFVAGASLFFDLLKNPRFEPGKLELVRDRLLDAIQRRNEDPDEIASREFSQQLFGEESVWARVSTAETVGSITRDEIRQFFESRVKPGITWLSVSGDISFSELKKVLGPLVSDWKGENPPPRPESKLAKEWVPSFQLISRPANQAAVMMGHFGDKRFNPDKYPLILANYILGGSTFGSRLGNRIRTALGLAYTVYSDFGLDTDYGRFYIAAGTKAPALVIEEAKKILQGMTRDFTEKELEDAKNTILNQLVFQYEDPFEIVETEVRYRFYGYPADYLTLFQKEIKKVTLDQLKGVVGRYFFPDRMKILVVGDPSLKGELKKLGRVEDLPLDND
ncbi:MAG: pitrilysin family protein [Deltaproteobacteria bacterium]|nr:pitrilysin family protein [Deltaproteobacteria bacterium]